jgi:selenide,water dikinase
VALAADAAYGLAFLHARGMVHADVKSANVLLFDAASGASQSQAFPLIAKLADFGFVNARAESGATRSSRAPGGSPGWMAPELWDEGTHTPSSDVYAMGARPILALAIVGMPINVLPVETIRGILAGGSEICAEAGIPVAGGHSIDSLEPSYGLVALGLVHPDRVMTNRAARAGDELILGKALGVGVLSAAFKQGRLDATGYAALVDSATRLNTPGPDLAAMDGVHAMTDVTGFGLLGHGLEMARGAGVTLAIDPLAPRLLPGAEALAREGVRTGASVRNWESYGADVRGAEDLDTWRRDLLSDPQTSGGLLVAAAPEAAGAVLAHLRAAGFDAARVGRFAEGPAQIRLVPGA